MDKIATVLLWTKFDGGVRPIDWAAGIGLHLIRNCLEKRKSRLITLQSSAVETVIDYILVSNRYRSRVKDVKVIPQNKK